MAKIKKFGKPKKTTNRAKKSPILHHKLQKTDFKKKDKKADTKLTPLTIQEHNRAIKLYLKHYEDGLNINNALDMSQKIDFERAKQQLSSTYARTITIKGVFVFTVKASLLNNFNEYGHAKDVVAKKQDVHIQWDLKDTENMSPKDILLNAPIKFECSCGRHTYWYRYIATKANASLGLQEHRFPERNNKELKGLFCKHTIRTIQIIKAKPFLATFTRYVDNYRIGVKSRLSKTDKAKIASGSFNNR